MRFLDKCFHIHKILIKILLARPCNELNHKNLNSLLSFFQFLVNLPEKKFLLKIMSFWKKSVD